MSELVETEECESEAPIRCPVCSQAVIRPMDPTILRWCRGCQTPHHLDCWRYNDGCAVYGCAPRTAPLVIQDDPDPSLVRWQVPDPLEALGRVISALAVVTACSVLLFVALLLGFR